MAHTVIMPKLGQTVETSTLVKWHKRVGDAVKKGDVLFEIETDKAVLEIESFFDGTLLKIIVQEGETVPVTAPVAFIGKPGEPLPAVAPAVIPAAPPPAAAPAAGASAKAASAAAAAGPLAIQAPVPLAPPAPAAAPAPRTPRVTPRARRLIRECGIGAGPIIGTGPGGRIVEKDVRAYLAAQRYDALRITPAAKALAIKEGLDLLTVERDGDRIALDAVRRALAERPQPMSKMRQIIAQRLAQSVVTAPHFFVTVTVDMTDLLALRKRLKDAGQTLTVTDFILRAVARALTEFPALNSSTDGRSVRWHSRVHLGMAVNVKEGLVVPVIRNADTLSLADLHAQAQTLAVAARDGKLLPDAMSGSTFTVSNMGMLDVDHFTAIINPGESAILAVASTREEPVVKDGAVTIRARLRLTLSADHRIVDGAMAAGFVNRIKQILENPDQC